MYKVFYAEVDKMVVEKRRENDSLFALLSLKIRSASPQVFTSQKNLLLQNSEI